MKNLARTRGMNVETARSREIPRRFSPQNDKNLEHLFILQRAFVMSREMHKKTEGRLAGITYLRGIA
ncbi:hypothetical protein NE562_16630 [Butyricicoccus faecihominis]|nr:hypothetical protein [Butyricicoccus faecihominis]